MGAYNYERFIQDFVKRTNINLKKIKYRYETKEEDRYEITQLINSLFGLLIVPNEKYKYRKNGNGVSESLLKGKSAYKSIESKIVDLKEDKRFYNSYSEEQDERYLVSDFIRHLRNSLAHAGNCGIHFLPFEEGKRITGIIFYDTNKEYGGNGEFCVELTVGEIEELAEDISEMYMEIEKDEEAEVKRQEYLNEVEERRKLFGRL